MPIHLQQCAVHHIVGVYDWQFVNKRGRKVWFVPFSGIVSAMVWMQQYSVALAYLPTRKDDYDIYHGHSFYPEGQEIGPAKFAIERRNRYLIDSADVCLCYVNHTFGGAYKFARMAKNRGLQVINLGSAAIEGNPHRGKKE